MSRLCIFAILFGLVALPVQAQSLCLDRACAVTARHIASLVAGVNVLGPGRYLELGAGADAKRVAPGQTFDGWILKSLSTQEAVWEKVGSGQIDIILFEASPSRIIDRGFVAKRGEWRARSQLIGQARQDYLAKWKPGDVNAQRTADGFEVLGNSDVIILPIEGLCPDGYIGGPRQADGAFIWYRDMQVRTALLGAYEERATMVCIGG